MTTQPKVMLWADDNRGIYAPQHALESLDLNACQLLDANAEDVEIVRDHGPDHPGYWEAWDMLQQNSSVFVPETGQRFFWYQDGAIWLIDETAQAGVDHELWDENE